MVAPSGAIAAIRKPWNSVPVIVPSSSRTMRHSVAESRSRGTALSSIVRLEYGMKYTVKASW